MSRENRQRLIREIESLRESRLLVYITGDKRGLETRISMDVYPFIFQHLNQIGFNERIDLYLYTPGGITIAGYGLVNILREFCNELNVIIPYKALSTGTLIALGANEIIMTKMSQLGPIDPSVNSPLGPRIPIPGQPNMFRTLPVNVEDAIGYLNLAEIHGKLTGESSKSKVFEKLSENVHPLLLGGVHRGREQIRFLARNLLKNHMDDEDRIENIVNIITEERFSHNYLIGRKEAIDALDLNVIDISPDLELKIIELFNQYNELLTMGVPYNPEVVLGTDESITAQFERCVVESHDLTHFYRTVKNIQRHQIVRDGVPQYGYLERVLSESWVEDNEL